ncbi:MAG: TerB family tellurite resistance protein [Flavobacteriaceae bacterium]|nr:TerB family tellurite resistance protein [Flavobacteriaceae bacterium]
MTISELYESGTQKSNIAHFAAITNIAFIDGELSEEERTLLFRFARKLDIDDEHFKEIMKDPTKFPVIPPHSKEEKLEYLHDLFRMIYVDHSMEKRESELVYKYAMALGFSSERAREIINKSIKIFNGKIDFEDYHYMIEKK